MAVGTDSTLTPGKDFKFFKKIKKGDPHSEIFKAQKWGHPTVLEVDY